VAISRWINEFREADGQALVEYALIVSLVAVICAGTLAALGVGVEGLMSGIPGAL
jgi:Flp pilus assembly pilin Flp